MKVCTKYNLFSLIILLCDVREDIAWSCCNTMIADASIWRTIWRYRQADMLELIMSR